MTKSPVYKSTHPVYQIGNIPVNKGVYITLMKRRLENLHFLFLNNLY